MLGIATKAKINEGIGTLLDKYSNRISKTYEESGEIAISLAVKVVREDGKNLITTKIAFVESKVVDHVVKAVNEEQRPLFTDNPQVSYHEGI